MYSDSQVLANNLSKAIVSTDLFADYTVPTFVRWHLNTLNTPYKEKLTYGQEGFALVFGKKSDYQTVIAWVKGGKNIWAHYYDQGTDYGWNEYAQKSDLSSFLDVVTAEYTVTLSANQSTMTSGSVTIKNGYTPLPKMLSVRTTGSDAVFASGDNYYENGKIYVYIKNTIAAERTIKVRASMLCYKS